MAKPTTLTVPPAPDGPLNLLAWLGRVVAEAREAHLAAERHALAAHRAGDVAGHARFSKISVALADFINATR
jgi:hypothetical protein